MFPLGDLITEKNSSLWEFMGIASLIYIFSQLVTVSLAADAFLERYDDIQE